MGDKATQKYLRKKVRDLMTILRENEEVALIHCAAGIHRTGSLGYTLLRLLSPEPLTKEQAYASLKILREDTWKQVGDWRVDLAEEYLVKPILDSMPEDPAIPEDQPAGMQAAAATMENPPDDQAPEEEESKADPDAQVQGAAAQ